MEAIPLILGGVKAVGTMASAFAGNAASRGRQAVYEQNATYLRQAALDELSLANADANRVRREGRREEAQQFAAFAQSGFAPKGFSVEKAGEATRTAIELDALTTMYKGELRARGQEVSAANESFKASAEKKSRGPRMFGAVLGAGTQLLSGYGQSVGVQIR
jgi:rubrerythrin